MSMINGLLGDRIGVIRRVLAPLTEVRILVPQPEKGAESYWNQDGQGDSEPGGFLPKLLLYSGSHRLAV